MPSARETILENVRRALEHPSHVPETVPDISDRVRAGLLKLTPDDSRGLAEQFKKEVEIVSGECHLCADATAAQTKLLELVQAAGIERIALDGHALSRAFGQSVKLEKPDVSIIDPLSLPHDERRARLAVTPAGLVVADHGIADTGSLVILYNCETSGLSHVLPETIFALLPIDRLLPNLYAVTDQVPVEQRKNMVLITGPSRTADIEKILILGAHGPKRLVVLIVGA